MSNFDDSTGMQSISHEQTSFGAQDAADALVSLAGHGHGVNAASAQDQQQHDGADANFPDSPVIIVCNSPVGLLLSILLEHHSAITDKLLQTHPPGVTATTLSPDPAAELMKILNTSLNNSMDATATANAAANSSTNLPTANTNPYTPQPQRFTNRLAEVLNNGVAGPAAPRRSTPPSTSTPSSSYSSSYSASISSSNDSNTAIGTTTRTLGSLFEFETVLRSRRVPSQTQIQTQTRYRRAATPATPTALPLKFRL